jgi:hypothetical protein
VANGPQLLSKPPGMLQLHCVVLPIYNCGVLCSEHYFAQLGVQAIGLRPLLLLHCVYSCLGRFCERLGLVGHGCFDSLSG